MGTYFFSKEETVKEQIMRFFILHFVLQQPTIQLIKFPVLRRPQMIF